MASNWSKRVEAGPRGDGPWRQDVRDPTGGVEARARVPRPQRVHDHPARAAGPEGGTGSQREFQKRFQIFDLKTDEE